MICIVCLFSHVEVTHEGTGFCKKCFKIARPQEYDKLQGYRDKLAEEDKVRKEKKVKDQVEREAIRIAKENEENVRENLPPVKKSKDEVIPTVDETVDTPEVSDVVDGE